MDNVVFELNDIKHSGKLNKKTKEIEFEVDRQDSNFFRESLISGKPLIIRGRIENNKKFIAFKCFIIEFKAIPKSSNIYIKISCETLYLNSWDVAPSMQIKKVDVRFSYMPNFLYEQQVYIEGYECDLIFNKYISISSKKNMSMKKIDEIIFELRTFFQIMTLNKDVLQIKIYYYIEQNKKIEKILKYDENINEQIEVQFLINKADKIDSNAVLNSWFNSKQKYGKIFNYLSGILKDSALSYLEFKYFALAQWIEAYGDIRFFTDEVRKEIRDKTKEDKQNVKEIIGRIEDVKDKEFLNKFYKFNAEDTFGIKLQHLFTDKALMEIFSGDESLLHNIKCYRNNLTHLNKEDNLDSEQMINLYEILKNIIFIFIMNELKLENIQKYKSTIDETKEKYREYKNLEASLEKCKSK